MAFMPQFVVLDQPLLPQLIILFSTFLCVGVVTDLGYTMLSTTGGQLMTVKFRRILYRCGASSLVGAGILMAVMRRPVT